MLSRSLTHSITAALIHTVSHSPLSDYYCYYCYHHQAYCEFCNYSPQQIYHGLYYAGYFSTWYSGKCDPFPFGHCGRGNLSIVPYADYYSRFFADRLELRLELDKEKEKVAEAETHNFDTLSSS